MIPRSAAARVVIGRAMAIGHGARRRDHAGVVHGFVCMDQPVSHPVDLARARPVKSCGAIFAKLSPGTLHSVQRAGGSRAVGRLRGDGAGHGEGIFGRREVNECGVAIVYFAGQEGTRQLIADG